MKAKLMAMTAMVIFGSIGLFVRNISLPSSVIAIVRGLLGVLFLILLGFFAKKRISPRAIRANGLLLALSGAALGANWVFLFEAYRHTTIAVATLSYYMAPVFIVILSPIVLKEKLTKTKVICVLASLAGMALVSGVFKERTQEAGRLTGAAFGVAAAMAYAGITFMNKYLKGISPLEATVAQLGISCLVVAPYAAMTGDFATLALDIRAAVFLAVLGVIHTGLAFWLYFAAIQHLGAQTFAMLSYLDPVTAILLSAMVLKERMGPAEAAGAVLMLGAMLAGEIIGNRFERARGSDNEVGNDLKRHSSG